jgi:hypothetical protein
MPGAQWKMPPLAKVYEALGAIGDGRVRIEDGQRASVTSSDGAKIYTVTYTVETSVDGTEISSNDNASFWQGYLGYPAIAMLIARGLIDADQEAVRALTGVPWKELNSRYRNDYDRTLEEVMRDAAARGYDVDAIRAAAGAVLEAVRKLAPRQGPRRRPPRAQSK